MSGFEVGNLSAALTLEGVPEFHRGLEAAGRKLTDTGSKGASFGKLGEQAVRAAAGATTGLVTAAGAYLTILAKTGVGYNSLQQNSRAALSVLLGGTEQANAQMSKLDDFARNSPFSKSVFIEAQQQLIGFGMEAGRVIPTLDAIQQGVAAMGGSGQQISEVVNILAKVQSTGKFTAETLNELGYRGVDAATLMGDAMGKTAAQMRDDISEGAIGGAEAIDILVEAMQTRFGGAADGVKEQWSGAVDRIKAAQRDLGAHLAEPFVSAEGGGMAVTWGNQVADVLRAIEKQAIPVMGILTERGMPFFAALTQGLDTSGAAIKRWDPASLSVSLEKMANHAPGIAALAGATLALGAQVGPLGTMLKTLGISANPVVAAFVGLAMASPELRDSLMAVLRAGEPLLPVVGDLAGILSGTLNSALPVVAGGLDVVASVLEVVLGVVAKIPTPIIAGAAAFLALHKASGPVEGAITGVADSLRGLAARGAGVAVEEVAGGIGNIGTASDIAKGGVGKLGDALKGAFLSNPIGIALTVVSTAVGIWATANAAAQQKIKEHNDGVAELKDTLNETTGAITEATEAKVKSSLADTRAKELADEMGISYRDMEQAILGNEDAMDRVTKGIDAHAAATTTGEKNMDSWSATATNGANRVREMSGILEEHRSRVEEAEQAKRDMIQAEREAAAAMTDAARSNQTLNEALAVARDTTQDAESRVRALKQALDELKGGAISAEEAEARLSETNLGLASGLAQADEAGNKLWQSTLNGSGVIDKSTQSGLDFYRTMDRSRDAMLDAARAASDKALADGDVAGAAEAARNAGEGYIATLRQTMADAGLTEEQINGLIGTYLDVPAVVATLLTDNDTVSVVEQRVQGLLTEMLTLEAGSTVSINVGEEGAEETVEKMRELGYEVSLSEDGVTYTITTLGEEEALNSIKAVNDARVPDKLFEVDADTVAALEGIDGVQVVQIDDKTSMVYGNNADATSKIEAVIAQQVPGKSTTITAEDGAFWGSWARIKLEQTISKVVQITTELFTVDKGKNFAGGMYSPQGKRFEAGGMVQASQYFAGGFPSGMYKGVNGGIWKPGIDGSMHNFAEAEYGVPWEVYISGKPEFRERNIQLALEALQLLGAPQADALAFPSVPRSSLGGTHFAAGGVVGARSMESRAWATPARPEINLSQHITVSADVQDPRPLARQIARETASILSEGLVDV